MARPGSRGHGPAASDKFRSVGRNLTSAGRSITAFATLPIAGGFGLALKAASDLNEQVSKMETVFGDPVERHPAFANTSAKKASASPQTAALEATGTFGNMFTTAGHRRPTDRPSGRRR